MTVCNTHKHTKDYKINGSHLDRHEHSVTLPKVDDVRKQENITCKFVLKSSYGHPAPNRTPEFYWVLRDTFLPSSLAYTNGWHALSSPLACSAATLPPKGIVRFLLDYYILLVDNHPQLQAVHYQGKHPPSTYSLPI